MSPLRNFLNNSPTTSCSIYPRRYSTVPIARRVFGSQFHGGRFNPLALRRLSDQRPSYASRGMKEGEARRRRLSWISAGHPSRPSRPGSSCYVRAHLESFLTLQMRFSRFHICRSGDRPALFLTRIGGARKDNRHVHLLRQAVRLSLILSAAWLITHLFRPTAGIKPDVSWETLDWLWSAK